MTRDAQNRRISHLNRQGQAKMVDVGDKPITRQSAVAEGYIAISRSLTEAIEADQLAKGNLLEVARLAGIQAAKRTDELIPLCHSLPIDAVYVQVMLEGERIKLRAEASTSWKTGVEMEALTAVCVAALTAIDMGKAVDPA